MQKPNSFARKKIDPILKMEIDAKKRLLLQEEIKRKEDAKRERMEYNPKLFNRKMKTGLGIIHFSKLERAIGYERAEKVRNELMEMHGSELRIHESNFVGVKKKKESEILTSDQIEDRLIHSGLNAVQAKTIVVKMANEPIVIGDVIFQLVPVSEKGKVKYKVVTDGRSYTWATYNP